MTLRRVLAGLALSACGGGAAGQSLDTSCPPAGASADALLAQIATRGLHGPPETARFELAGETVMVAWKNLLSGRALTLSCAYRPEGSGWKLLRARLDDGTHSLRLSARLEPPALIYRDDAGRLLEEVTIR